MNGAGSIRFSELFADTVQAHGLFWAWCEYVERNKMPEWEWQFWVEATGTGSCAL